jgi:hypothetical protein
MTNIILEDGMTLKVFNADYRGYVKIGNVEIPCAVLENGKRVISQTGLFQCFERPRKGEVRQEGLPSILGAKNLLPFVTDEVRKKCVVIPFLHSNGKIAYGYDAELIPLVCEVYLKAHDKGDVLHSTQNKIAAVSQIIIRSLAKLGIIALIDEATGAQYDREKDALQKILSAYIAEDFLKWQARFPRKFYQEVFRLYHLKYDPISLKRPQFLGTFTNKYVYKMMPPGVLEELRKRNPVTEKGVRGRKHHQLLTEEIGVTHLERHITKLVTVMELSDSPRDFDNKFQKVFHGAYQSLLDLDDPKNLKHDRTG